MSRGKYKNFLGMHVRINDTGQVVKKCTQCEKEKPLTFEYYCHSSRNKSGFQSACKECGRAKEKTKERIEWRKHNRQQPHIMEYRKQYEKERRSKPEYKARKNILERSRKESDPSFCLKNRVRILMYHTLRHVKKGRKWQELVGYSINDLRNSIEKQFKDGMSWERFAKGEIHIDHIIPVAAFNYTKPEDIDFKKCWALKNLRPMWKHENLIKSNKIVKPHQPSLALRV